MMMVKKSDEVVTATIGFSCFICCEMVGVGNDMEAELGRSFESDELVKVIFCILLKLWITKCTFYYCFALDNEILIHLGRVVKINVWFASI